MTTKMTHAMRMELANAIRDRYAAASNKDKHRILEEFVAATGYVATGRDAPPEGARRRNSRLKKIVADLTLDRKMLQDVIRRKLVRQPA